ncbi:MAG: hypothetical protein ACOCP9_07400 [Halofilum sp. (in: g-proteobacteria)]
MVVEEPQGVVTITAGVLAFLSRVIYTFGRQRGVIDLFTGKRKSAKQTGAEHESHDGTAIRSTISVIEDDTILLKSPRGREEIQTRAHELSTLCRRLLIIADGQHTVTDLARQLGCAADDDTLKEALRQLVADRYLHISDEYDRRRRGTASGRGKQATA